MPRSFTCDGGKEKAMPRFFVAGTNLFGGGAYVSKEDAKTLKAIDLGEGGTVVICDKEGTEHKIKYKKDENGVFQAEKTGGTPAKEPDVYCAMYIAYAETKRLADTVKKCTELGASAIVLYPTDRSKKNPEIIKQVMLAKKLQKVAYASAQEVRRGTVPKIYTAESFEKAVDYAKKADLSLFLYEDEDKVSLGDVMKQGDKPKRISIMSGAEKGFSPKEVLYAKTKGLTAVSLGSRVIGCDTAPICALSSVMLLSGNMTPDEK